MKTSRLYNILLLFALALMPGMAQAQGGADSRLIRHGAQNDMIVDIKGQHDHAADQQAEPGNDEFRPRPCHMQSQ